MPENNNSHTPEDPLEELFQEKAGEYDIPYREEDWNKLEKRLDLADRERALEAKRRWLIAVSILLFSLLGYATYYNFNAINEVSEQLNEQNEHLADEVESDSDEPFSLRNIDELSSADQESEPDASADQLVTEPLIPAEELRSVPPSVLVEDENEESDRTFLVSEQNARALSTADLSCGGCQLSSWDVSDSPKALAKTKHKQGRQVHLDDLAADYNETPSLATSRLAVAFVTGPDFSTSGEISNFSDPGYKIGAAVEYRLSENLSISGGVIQSDVRYTARGGAYNPNGSYWNNGILPDETYARCLILDIPLTLKYDVWNFNRSRIFASAGVASYVMLSEEYEFSYEQYRDDLAQSWDARTGKGYWLSNAGFSVGFEYDLHTNWSVRAEPFLRVPLKGVGEGNVKLYSAGSLISLSYRL